MIASAAATSTASTASTPSTVATSITASAFAPTLRTGSDLSTSTEATAEASAPVQTTSRAKTRPTENVFIVEAEKYDDAKYEANQVINYNATKEKFVESGTGEGREEHPPNKKVDESKKTLADQVAEGKYGLIQNELFKKQPRRPGILSYAPNAEVPNDTADNLGGLSKDEIWLAEDHLLVLKGGTLNEGSGREPWKPIDDYEAPLRQVKIPDNPEVPPPFPIQLEENGPIQLVGNHQLPLVNPFTNETLLLFPDSGFPKTETYSPDQKNVFARPGAAAAAQDDNGDHAPPGPLAYGRPNNFTFANPFLSPFPPEFVGPPLHPFPFPFPPNGSLENSNFTDFIDEDDPSFFYPPPYSFVYKRNYSNLVEPGPLVPGIILPPPPNFFGRLNPAKNSTRHQSAGSSTTPRPTKQFLRPVFRPTPAPTPTTTSSAPTSVTHSRPPKTRIVTAEPARLPIASAAPKRVTQLQKLNGPDIIAFVPKDAIDTVKSSKGKPIYYEYFDARDKSSQTTTTARPVIQQQPTPKSLRRPYNAYLPVKSSFNYEKYPGTAKPETKHKAVSENVVKIDDGDDIGVQPPLPNYTSEIENIRHTIEFFKTQQKQPTTTDASIPRNPKSKGIFEYSFELAAPKLRSKTFSPPKEFDLTPFKPMVNYSPPLNANNGFKGIPYTTVPTLQPEADYSSTTEPAPSTGYYTTITNYPSRQIYTTPKSSVRYIPIDTSVLRSYPIESLNRPNDGFRYSTLRPPISSTVPPWLTVEKQILREVQPKEINVQIQSHTPTAGPHVAPYESSYVNANSAGQPLDGFYPSLPVANVYTHTTHKPVKNGQQSAYLRQIEVLRQELERFPNQYRIRVSNGTHGAYRQARPLLGQDQSFVSPYQWGAHRYPQLSDLLAPHYPHSQQQQSPPQTLHKDVLVNYKYPLPPIDPDSEFLPPPALLPPVPPPLPTTQLYYNRYSRLNRNPTVVRYKLPGDHQAGVYFYTPQADSKYGGGGGQRRK